MSAIIRVIVHRAGASICVNTGKKTEENSIGGAGSIGGKTEQKLIGVVEGGIGPTSKRSGRGLESGIAIIEKGVDKYLGAGAKTIQISIGHRKTEGAPEKRMPMGNSLPKSLNASAKNTITGVWPAGRKRNLKPITSFLSRGEAITTFQIFSPSVGPVIPVSSTRQPTTEPSRVSSGGFSHGYCNVPVGRGVPGLMATPWDAGQVEVTAQ